jgi:HAD superfamily hydrolase (TIGR01509 family)
MKIKGAIFDMDGTLVDSLFFWPHFWRRLGETYMNKENFTPDEEVDKNIRTMIYVDAMKYIKEYYHIDADIKDFMTFGTNSLADFYTHEAAVKEGAVALLEHLKRQNARICLASATDIQYVKLALTHFDLMKYFDCVISCSEIGVGKDRPDIYLLAAKKLSLDPSELCVFEDSFVALETAKQAGFLTVGIFDKYAFAQDRLRAASDFYLGEGQGLDALTAVVTVEN